MVPKKRVGGAAQKEKSGRLMLLRGCNWIQQRHPACTMSKLLSISKPELTFEM